MEEDRRERRAVEEKKGSEQIHGHLGRQMAKRGDGSDLRSRMTPGVLTGVNGYLRWRCSSSRWKLSRRNDRCDMLRPRVGDSQVKMLEGD